MVRLLTDGVLESHVRPTKGFRSVGLIRKKRKEVNEEMSVFGCGKAVQHDSEVFVLICLKHRT